LRVVVAEKPSVGRDIARVLGARNRRDGYLEGNGYLVTWAIGHLVHYYEPDDYGGSWKGRWSLGQLPMIPDEWKLKSDAKTKKQLDIVKGLLCDPRTTEVICATDAGREGEHIFRLIYTHSRCRKPVKRLWISSLTDEAIREGFAALKPGSAFDDLALAAQARAKADWLVGMNLTRAYTVHAGALCTIGRVQTPTLAMIVAREEQITRFKKAFFYEIAADLEPRFTARYVDAEGKTRIDEKPVAERLHAKLVREDRARVVDVGIKKERHGPPMLFDLITLQKTANRRFGFTAARVLSLAQELYEKLKLITYPRTESRHISEDMLPRLPGILEASDQPMAPRALERLRAGHRLSKKYVDATKLSDHHGIVPTARRAPPSLSPDLRKIYDLVSARFVAIFFPDHVVEVTTVSLEIGGETFRARGHEILEEGWKAVEPDSAAKREKQRKLPPLEVGQVLSVNEIRLEEKETKPPKRFSDATLLTAMKNAGKTVEDEALAEAMKETGLGTPATRASIIERLIRTKLIERSKKVLHPTAKGMALIGLVAEPLRSPELTGTWEQRLEEIKEGALDDRTFYDSIVAMVRELIPMVTRSPRGSMAEFNDRKKKRHRTGPARNSRTSKPDPAKRVCPRCGLGNVIEGKTAWGCNRFREGCQFRIPFEIAGKKVTDKQAQHLLTKGRTGMLKGFKGPEGQTFSARMVLDQHQTVTLDKSARPARTTREAEPMTCPRCSRGTIIEGKRGFGCNRYREGCHFVVWKEVAGKKLTPSQIRQLITKGKTRLIKGFTSPQGKRFDARLRLDSHREPEFELAGER